MNLRFSILLCILLITIEIHSQSDFRPGYILKTTGDKIFGLIDYRGDLLMGKVCRFKVDEKDKVNVFNPDEIIEYRRYAALAHASKLHQYDH